MIQSNKYMLILALCLFYVKLSTHIKGAVLDTRNTRQASTFEKPNKSVDSLNHQPGVMP